MQTHKDKIVNHQVHAKIEQLLDTLQNDVANVERSKEVVDELNREILILRIAQEVFSSINDQLLSVEKLNTVSSAIDNLSTEFNRYKSYNQEPYFSNMITYSDQIMSNVAGYRINDDMQYRILTKYADNITYILGVLKTSIHCNNADLIKQEEKIKELDTKIGNIKSDIDRNKKAADDSNEARLSQLETRISEFKARMEAEADRLKKRNDEEIQKSTDIAKEKMLKMAEDYKHASNEVMETTVKLQEETDAILKDYVEKVKAIVGQVNTTMFSYKYKEVADNAAKRNFHWNLAGFICVLVSLGICYWTFVYMSGNTKDEHFMFGAIARSVMVMIALTATAHCFNQADKQGKIERYARKIEMELIAFDTFVENLPDEEKQELKQSVVKRIFIDRDNIIDESAVSKGNTVVDLLQKILERISSIGATK